MIFSVFFLNGFWGILGSPSYGIGATIRISREMLCVQYAGFFYDRLMKSGKNLVFAMTIKLILDFWRNQEIPKEFWKSYEQVKTDLFQNFYLFLILFLIPEYCHPEPQPTTLGSYLIYYV